MNKPFSEASEENKQPILRVLLDRLAEADSVLEIGSGTGQHAVCFAAAMPHLLWQTSDLPEMHPGIRSWLEEAGLANLPPPLVLDVANRVHWPSRSFTAVYSANTAHIMSPAAVTAMFAYAAHCLPAGGRFLLYGPFMYDGRHTAVSNARFDAWLRTRAQHQGVRDLAWLKPMAQEYGLLLEEDIGMPVNNRILHWRRVG